MIARLGNNSLECDGSIAISHVCVSQDELSRLHIVQTRGRRGTLAQVYFASVPLQQKKFTSVIIMAQFLTGTHKVIETTYHNMCNEKKSYRR